MKKYWRWILAGAIIAIAIVAVFYLVSLKKLQAPTADLTASLPLATTSKAGAVARKAGVNFENQGFWFVNLMFADIAHELAAPVEIVKTGANLVTFTIPAKIDRSGNVAYELASAKTKENFFKRFETLVKRYHDLGAQVMVAMELTEVADLSQMASEPNPFTGNQDLSKFEAMAVEIAELAEKNKVEYFSPLSEPDRKLGSRYLSFSESVLTKVKKVYSGKTVLKGDDPSKSVKGYDILGISLTPETTDMATYRALVKTRLSKLEKMKIGKQEIWVTEFGTWANIGAFSEAQKAAAYRVVLEEAMGRVAGVNAYEPMMRDSWKIKGTKIYNAIKEFYTVKK